jgi:FKBP-type peptidyl-prolyl cis-trans isomerase
LAKEAAVGLPLPVSSINTSEEHLLKVLGQIIARNAGLINLGLKPSQIDQIVYGLKAVCNGEESPDPTPEQIGALQQFCGRLEGAQTETNKELGAKYLDKKQNEPGFQKRASGVLVKIDHVGDNKRTTLDSLITVNYKVYSINGKSLDEGQGISIRPSEVIPGLREVFGLVGQGGKLRAIIPSESGYGDESVGPIPGGSTLDFSIEVVEIISPTPEKEEPKGKAEPKKEEPKGKAELKKEEQKTDVKPTTK